MPSEPVPASATPSWSRLTIRSNAVTGQLLVLVLVIGFIGSLATGSDYTGVFATLCAIGGVCFIGCTVWFSRRG